MIRRNGATKPLKSEIGTFPLTLRLENNPRPSRLVAHVAACVVQCSMRNVISTLFHSSSVMMSIMVLIMGVIIQLVATSPPHRMRENSWPLDAFHAPLLRLHCYGTLLRHIATAH